MDVVLTVDVEIWPEDWNLDPKRFPTYFSRYIVGESRGGDVGLLYQLRRLAEHRLKAVFFVESLFACEFGLSPLSEIVSMIRESGQEVQLHLHTEWVSKMTRSILPGRSGLNIRDFAFEEQICLINVAMQNLGECGVEKLCAFRAGNFGANRDTLRALDRNGIHIDSSYNRACKLGPIVSEEIRLPVVLEEIQEFPVAVFRDGRGLLRHAQVGACSSQELHGAFERAHALAWPVFVAFWHSAELLNERKSRRNAIVARRFDDLCSFLGNRSGEMPTRWFSEVDGPSTAATGVGEYPQVPLGATLRRYAEQLIQRASIL